MADPVYNQEDFRFRNDDGTLATATWVDGDTVNNNNKTIAVDANFRLRFVVQQTNAAKTVNNATFQLRYSYNDGGYSAGTQVTTTSTYVQLVDDANSIADNATTQQRIGDGTYGTGDSQGYNDGQTDALTGDMDFNGAQECEIEVCLQIVGADLSDGDTLDFQLYLGDGTALDSYGSTPRATASKPVEVTAAGYSVFKETALVTAAGYADLKETALFTAAGFSYLADIAASTFPQVAASNTSQESTATDTHTVSLPGSISSGDLLLVFMAVDAGSAPFTSFPAGWTEIKDASETQDFVTLAVAYRVADGEEGASISVTTTPSAQSAHASYRITGHDSANAPEISTGASGDSNTADPDSLTPGGGSKDYLWIAICAVDGSGSTGPWAVTAAPSGYGNLVSSESGGATDGATIGLARLENTASSEDPGTFSLEEVGGKEWFAATLAVYPGGETTYSVTAAMESIFKETASATAPTYAVTKETASATTAFQSILKETASVVVDGFANLKETASQTAAGQAAIKMATGVTVAGASWLQDFVNITAAGYASLNTAAGQAVLKETASVTAALQSVFTETASATAALFSYLQDISGAAVTAALRSVLKETASAIAAGYSVFKETASNTAAGQAILDEVASFTAALQSAFKETASATAALYSYLQDLGAVDVVVNLYANLKETASNTAAGQAIIKMATSATAALESWLQDRIETIASGYAVLKESASATAAGQAWLQMRASVTAALSSLLQQTADVTAALRSVFSESQTATTALYSRLADIAAVVTESDLVAAPRTFSLAAPGRVMSVEAQPRSFTSTAGSRPSTLEAQPRPFTLTAEDRDG
jgi:hypothetical protein